MWGVSDDCRCAVLACQIQQDVEQSSGWSHLPTSWLYKSAGKCKLSLIRCWLSAIRLQQSSRIGWSIDAMQLQSGVYMLKEQLQMHLHLRRWSLQNY